MKYVGSFSVFCEFGSEWTQKNPNLGGTNENPAQQTASSALKWGEIMLMFLLDILIIMLLATLFYAAYSNLPWLAKKCIENGDNWVGKACIKAAGVISNVISQ